LGNPPAADFYYSSDPTRAELFYLTSLINLKCYSLPGKCVFINSIILFQESI
jgi:hypothetical protein